MEKLTKEEIKYISALNGTYQSQYLPIFSRAELKIKEIIMKYFWNLKPKRELMQVLNAYLKEIDKKIPKDLPNRDAYIDGLKKKTDKMVKEYYIKALASFGAILSIVLTNQAKIGVKMPKISTPQQLTTYIKSNKIKYRMWEQAKAAIRVQDYPKKLENYIGSFSKETIVTSEPGKKGITLWQKAELDVRYAHQMEMLEECRKSGKDLWWISSHPDCSKRCEKWQGKLVSINKHATMSGFRVGKVDGNWVYSLTDIMAQKDKYGYNNNIICGFNCRHYLKEYTKNSVPPKQYEHVDIEKMRKINDDLRAMERKIKFYKTKEKGYNVIGDYKNAKICHHKASVITKLYVETCNKYGFAEFKFRIDF